MKWTETKKQTNEREGKALDVGWLVEAFSFSQNSVKADIIAENPFRIKVKKNADIFFIHHRVQDNLC